MVYQLITVICLAILFLELVYVIVNACKKNRHERIEFFRSFKKGKCAIIFLTAIPLYVIGHMYDGEGFLNAFFKAINKIINLVVLKYDVSSIQSLMDNNSLYAFTVYFTFVLVLINALIFTLSLTNQHIWCGLRTIGAYFTRKEKLYIFGNNEENVSIYLSDKKRNKVIIDNLSQGECASLYMDKIAYISTHSFKDRIESIFREIKKFDRQIVLVINTGNDETNISVCRQIINEIEALSKEEAERMFLELKAFVFGDPRYEAIYEDVVSSAYGCIHLVNKYQKIAMDFIDSYPLTAFMDERQIDYENSFIKEGVDINVLLIGFGKTNQQIFLTSVANNQFLTKGENNGVALKQVRYLIFDKDESENNKNLNHSYYRYQHEMLSGEAPDGYLPLPDLPATEQYFKLDINNKDFYNQIKNVVSRSKDDANYIVIAFGSDLENIDMAQKLVEKRQEWGIENLIIFVKVRKYHCEDTLLQEKNCFFIGNELDSVYNIEKILGDKLFKMAQMRNEVYDLEYEITHNEKLKVDEVYVEQNRKNAYKNWYKTKTQLERDSSLYCCLSLRSKLHLMNLDYCPANDERRGLSYEEYIKIYAKKDLPDTETYNIKAEGKPIVAYPLVFKESRRKNMAIHEHFRWNSFMISKGLVPSSIEQILTETFVDENGKVKNTNGRNYRLRRHGNITTFEGLVTYRELLAKRDKSTEKEKDVIKYDYQLLDDAYWLLSENGFKIIQR